MYIWRNCTIKQECIPVGCVPSAAVAVCWGGGGVCLSACWDTHTHTRPGPGHPLGLGLDTSQADTPSCGQTDTCKTRMHSSRMHNAHSSSHLLGGVCLSACWDTPQGVGLETPPPLGVGLETCKACWDPTPWRPARHAGIPPAMHAGIPPPSNVYGILDTCYWKYYLAQNFVSGKHNLRKLHLRTVINIWRNCTNSYHVNISFSETLAEISNILPTENMC